MEIFPNIALGLSTALSFHNLLYCFIGVFLGTFVGVIPGIGAISAISILFPITFYLDPTTALIMLAGIWYGAGYGGRTASILLNLPGTVSNAVTCLDGYPMTRQGRGGVALLMTTIASFVGGSIGIVLLMLLAPVIGYYALSFGSAEYFALMVLGLVSASTISDGSAIKGLAMVVLGLMFGTVGLDMYTGVPRFSFGILALEDTISLVALAMGVFGVAEVIAAVRNINIGSLDRATTKLSAMKPTRDDVRRSWMPVLRGSSIGAFFGTLPGTGPAIATFLSYAIEKRVSSEPQRFGNGAIEGVMAPESADNSAEMTAFIPTLSLGIPGSPTMALMLGVLMIHGIQPGPRLMIEQPSLFWGLIMSFWIGNVLLLILNIPLIGMWVKVLTIPYRYLYPSVLVFICIGTYTINDSAFDVGMVVCFGLLGHTMRIFDWPAAPVLLGFVLGPLMEEHFRRAMLLSYGDYTTFIQRPISLTIVVITFAMLAWGIRASFNERRKARKEMPIT